VEEKVNLKPVSGALSIPSPPTLAALHDCLIRATATDFNVVAFSAQFFRL
jgi:hypothetical protein